MRYSSTNSSGRMYHTYAPGKRSINGTDNGSSASHYLSQRLLISWKLDPRELNDIFQKEDVVIEKNVFD